MPILSPGARRALSVATVLACTIGLSACDYVSGFTKPKMTPEEAKAEGMALGAGCRQAGQTLETCYQNNDAASKAGIFAGWKDMHEYMAAKNIATVYAPGTEPPVKTEAQADAEQSASSAAKDKDAAKSDKDARDGSKSPKDKDARDSSKSGKDAKDARDSKDARTGKDTKSADNSRDPKPRDEKAHERADRARGDRARARDDSTDKNLADSRTGRLADPASR